MGDNPDTQEADQAPPPPTGTKVEITVAGHTIVVESATDSLAAVAGHALRLYEWTAKRAERIPAGFDTTSAALERAAPYVEPGSQPWEDDHVGPLGG